MSQNKIYNIRLAPETDAIKQDIHTHIKRLVDRYGDLVGDIKKLAQAENARDFYFCAHDPKEAICGLPVLFIECSEAFAAKIKALPNVEGMVEHDATDVPVVRILKVLDNPPAVKRPPFKPGR